MNEKILLIDDDTSLLVTLSDFLSFEGYQVTTADSGEQGLQRLKTMTPDLIILDMSMPGMGGVGFLRAISSPEGRPDHPVLVLTARANMAGFFSTMDVDGFIAKPCEPDDLLAAINKIIGSAPVPPATARKSADRKKVLLAEDDKAVNEILIKAFARAGYLVDSVLKGPDVLEKAIVGKPDIVVIKLVLANMNGDAVAGMLGEMPNTASIPVILYDDSGSGSSEEKYRQSVKAIKKFLPENDASSLLAAVEQVLAG